ncbi:hypothetical protein RE428_12750 [Marinobacter nanhaiticus D15-8W]|uniref:Bacteriophage N4 adsorption protein A C-terminal domain-containing protein n=1 Tax=Marinobacter nanhaiticus D15-8W TaxID=626887 RepID=N6WN29_9GAMM|nr:tetratricopeptide repeat protein [Marinobacter nanhaiticus]ENO12906.1 hypothetical protein J057_15950 [Marinobacter nanhaiticus D15-8W]BES70257.1 hypothetical protein RE428_12750 [Marinobacter nanhaiticus D15-8W]
MGRRIFAAGRSDDHHGHFRVIQNRLLFVALIAFSPLSGAQQAEPPTQAEVATGSDSEASTWAGRQSWLQQELAKFRKYPYLERAERLIGAGQSEAAADELERVLALDPDDVDVRLRLVVLLLGPLDKPGLAGEQASKLIERDRELGLAYHYRALAKLYLEDTDGAVADWRRALDTGELSKDRSRYIRRQLADIAIQRGDFAAVPPLLEDDGADQPFEDRMRLTRAYLELDRPAEASQILFQAVLEVEDVPPGGWLTIAQYQLELDKPALAAVTINRGLEVEEPAALRRELATSLGHLHMQRGRPDLAARAFAQAAEEGEPDAALYLAWAQALAESQSTAQALDVIETVEQTSPYGRRLHAQLLADMGRPEDAARVLTRLTEDPSQGENAGVIALEIADLYARAGESEAQMAALERAVSLMPDYSPALRALAERQIGAGELAAASATLERLVAIEDSPSARLRLVDVLLASDDYPTALVELRLLAESLPSGHPERMRVLRQWAIVAEAEQQWPDAARAWEGLYLADNNRPPELLLQAARAARLGDQPALARQFLDQLASDDFDNDALAPGVRAALFEERAQLALLEGDRIAAAQSQQQAVIAQPTAARHYQMAQIWNEVGETGNAHQALQQAVMMAPDNAEYQATLGYAYVEGNDDQRAAEHFEAALAIDPGRLSLYEELAYTYRRLGRDEAEARMFGELVRRQAGGARSHDDLTAGAGPKPGGVARLRLEQAQALRRAGLPAQALEVLESSDDLTIYGTRLKVQLLMEMGRLEDAERELNKLLDSSSRQQAPGPVALEIAEMHARAGDTDAQLAALERAVALAPDYTPALNALVERQVGAGDLQGAANTQRRLVELEGGTDARARLVDILLAAENFDAASVELQQLVEDLPPENPDRARVMRQWAGVAEAEGQWAAAAQAWEALYRTDDTQSESLMLHAGRAARLSGQFAKADQMLAQVSEDELTRGDQALLYEERARLASLEGDTQRAAEAQRRAVWADPTAERHYRLAQYQLELDELASARSELLQAVMLEPDNAEFQASLGYAHLNAGEEALAADHFEAALAAEPQRLPLYEELGYVYRRLGEDEAAAKAFRARIDLAQAGVANGLRGDSKSDNVVGTGTDEAGYELRREVQQLEDRLRIGAGLFVRRMNGDGTSALDAPLGLAGFQSQAGVDIGYRLDDVSDGRFVEVFGRSLWAFEEDTLSPEGSETQGGVGLRVKPFAPVNFFLSGERLVALGSDARNDWMLRASASFNRGSAYVPDQTYQHYRSVYLDAALVVDDSAEFLVGEWREGLAIRVGQGLGVAPYAVAAVSYTDDAETERRYEIGPGIALRGWFGGDAYHTHSSELELGLEYREVVGGNTDEDSGVVVRLYVGF